MVIASKAANAGCRTIVMHRAEPLAGGVKGPRPIAIGCAFGCRAINFADAFESNLIPCIALR